MMNSKAKALIIGFGSIGKKHFLALKELGFEVSVLSKSADESLFEEFGSFEIYRFFEECDLSRFDYFIIANITTKHFETLKKLDSLVKDKIILVEKPLFESYKSLNLQNKVFVAYLLRFNPILQKLKELCVNLSIYNASIVCKSYLPWWRKGDYKQNYSAKKELGGGVLLDLSHELDYAMWLFGDLNLIFSKNATISELEITSDDFAFLCFESKKAFVSISLDCFCKFNERKIIIDSKECSIKADLIGNFIEIYDVKQKCLRFDFEANTLLTLKALHKGVLNNDKNTPSLDQALKLLKICDKIKKENQR
ncbi:gfo/Idh/MocA family oxidoreductase [Campylobacter sp. MIT 99-7217]|uniref:Gfo/Idh/MocA family protein n=1 Tax=Campylobacter sp. MIT 99-7217 TaxID=535091 RepID=UPI001C8E4409|nr:Gfo/Idh/MocA family oxidoreductase [Campylobacter sp. MIT 99-7217]TQR33878.1 gfo/Idh/MocA family oxidoreductase [Campylobacter sp. MIT 99-7217]